MEIELFTLFVYYMEISSCQLFLQYFAACICYFVMPSLLTWISIGSFKILAPLTNSSVSSIFVKIFLFFPQYRGTYTMQIIFIFSCIFLTYCVFVWYLCNEHGVYFIVRHNNDCPVFPVSSSYILNFFSIPNGLFWYSYVPSTNIDLVHFSLSPSSYFLLRILGINL